MYTLHLKPPMYKFLFHTEQAVIFIFASFAAWMFFTCAFSLFSHGPRKSLFKCIGPLPAAASAALTEFFATPRSQVGHPATPPSGIASFSLTSPSSTRGASFLTSPFASFGCLSQTSRSYCFRIAVPISRAPLAFRPYSTRLRAFSA